MVLPMTFENLVSTVVGLEGFVTTKTLLKKKKSLKTADTGLNFFVCCGLFKGKYVLVLKTSCETLIWTTTKF